MSLIIKSVLHISYQTIEHLSISKRLYQSISNQNALLRYRHPEFESPAREPFPIQPPTSLPVITLTLNKAKTQKKKKNKG